MLSTHANAAPADRDSGVTLVQLSVADANDPNSSTPASVPPHRRAHGVAVSLPPYVLHVGGCATDQEAAMDVLCCSSPALPNHSSWSWCQCPQTIGEPNFSASRHKHSLVLTHKWVADDGRLSGEALLWGGDEKARTDDPSAISAAAERCAQLMTLQFTLPMGVACGWPEMSQAASSELRVGMGASESVLPAAAMHASAVCVPEHCESTDKHTSPHRPLPPWPQEERPSWETGSPPAPQLPQLVDEHEVRAKQPHEQALTQTPQHTPSSESRTPCGVGCAQPPSLRVPLDYGATGAGSRATPFRSPPVAASSPSHTPVKSPSSALGPLADAPSTVDAAASASAANS